MLDQPSFMVGRRTGEERVVIALKAGFELESQPTFDAPDVVLIKEIRGQTGDLC